MRNEMEANNMKAIRDALMELMQFTCNSCQERLCESDCEEGGAPVPCSAILKARAAIALPPRTCDVGTIGEQYNRFDEFCASHYQEYSVGHCEKCPFAEPTCKFAWAQMPYEEGGVK